MQIKYFCSWLHCIKKNGAYFFTVFLAVYDMYIHFNFKKLIYILHVWNFDLRWILIKAYSYKYHF